VIVGSGLTGCATAPAPIQASIRAPDKPDPYVGTKRWVNSRQNVMMCPRPGGISANGHSRDENKCRYLDPGTALSFQEDVIYHFVHFYRVQLDSGEIGYVNPITPNMMDTEGDRRRSAAAKADCDRRGGISVGMTREQVYSSCWGKPQGVNKTVTGNSVHEQFVYGSNYVYLEDGVVRTIQTSSTQ
jgi:hypothetical protein